jgi:hypothetical protein
VKIIGALASALTMALAVLGAVVLVKSLPDIRRYLKIRSM